MSNNLNKYNKKRDFTRTKEPKGKIIKCKENKKLKFVIQHHKARRDHYDLRLEWNGTMKSWAVPKGPSFNPKDRRLAIKVEDHPISYNKFEGTIPKGEYGGGTVMIWDEGYWKPLKENKLNFTKGSIKFKLNGKRLKGIWNLVYLSDDNWLLIKDSDEEEKIIDINKWTTSIKTGRTMEEIAENKKIKKEVIDDDIICNVKITSKDKVIYSKPKITKLDIVKYYEMISDRMMPFLENRLISTIRCPNGMNGDIFFKKHLETKSKGIGKKIISNEKGNKEDYYYIKNTEGLIAEVQMNSYEFHTWGSSASDINHPNIMVFDLDPDELMSLKKVRDGVKDLKEILDELKLPSYLKTSGGKGYHIVVPFNSKITWRRFREIAKNIADLMEAKYPDKYTSNMRKDKRKNKIFIDWVRNNKGATSVAPYSLRLRPKAPISMPIAWEDLDKIKPNEITLKNVNKYLKNKDPWETSFKIIVILKKINYNNKESSEIMKVLQSLIKIILNIISAILIIIIVLNLLNIISTKVLKKEYPDFLGLTYFNIEKNDLSLNLNKGDILIVDFNKAPQNGDIIIYKKNNNYVGSQLKNLGEHYSTIVSNNEEQDINNNLIIGKVTKKIPKIGNILAIILKFNIFIIACFILIIISVIQSIINKKWSTTKKSKPNFNQTY